MWGQAVAAPRASVPLRTLSEEITDLLQDSEVQDAGDVCI